MIELHHNTPVEEIFRLGGLQPENPLVIELTGYRLPYLNDTIWTNFDYHDREVYRVWNKLGHHPQLWKESCLEL